MSSAWCKHSRTVCVDSVPTLSISAGSMPGTSPAWSVFGALSLRLSHAQLARFDEAGAIEPAFPHDFLGSDGIDEVVCGGTRGRIQNDRGWI